MERHEAENSKSQEDIKRELLWWHIGYWCQAVLMIATIVLLFLAAHDVLEFLTSRSIGLLLAHLYVALLIGVVAICTWRLHSALERRLLKVAEQRREDHPFYGKFIRVR